MIHIYPDEPLRNVAALQDLFSKDNGDGGINGDMARNDQGNLSNRATMKTSDGRRNSVSGASAGGGNDKRNPPLALPCPQLLDRQRP